MLSENHNLNLKLRSKQYNKIDLLHPIVVPQLSGSRQHNYPTKTRELGRANEQSMYSLMSMKKNEYNWALNDYKIERAFNYHQNDKL